MKFKASDSLRRGKLESKRVKATSEEVTPQNGYIDLYLLPVPTRNLAPYRRQATIFGRVAREYGALNYREFIGDDLFPKGVMFFTSAIELGPDEGLTVAVAEFKSRSHRNRVMKQVLNDPRIREMMKEKPLANMKKMHYGGFKTVVITSK